MLRLTRGAFVVFILSLSAEDASATGAWCGVFDYSADATLNLRAAPSPKYRITGKASKSDLLFIDTAQCRDDFGDGSREFGEAVCSPDRRWVFVEKVVPNEITSSSMKGWANSRYIREVGCPDFQSYEESVVSNQTSSGETYQESASENYNTEGYDTESGLPLVATPLQNIFTPDFQIKAVFLLGLAAAAYLLFLYIRWNSSDKCPSCGTVNWHRSAEKADLLDRKMRLGTRNNPTYRDGLINYRFAYFIYYDEIIRFHMKCKKCGRRWTVVRNKQN
jgi:hypothetical protein